MPNSTSYALFPLANHRVLSTTTLLSTPSRWLSLHCTDKTLGELQYVSTKIQNNEQQGWSNRVQTTRVHCYFVFTWILLHRVLFLFASAAAAAAAAHKNQLQWSWEAKAKSPLPQRADAKAATYRWDLPNRLHYIPNTICPTCYVSCLTGNMRKLNEETR